MLGIDWAKMPGMTSAKAPVKASYFKSLFGIQGHTKLFRNRSISTKGYAPFNWYFKGIAVNLTGIDKYFF
jgi:hypothetical protein